MKSGLFVFAAIGWLTTSAVAQQNAPSRSILEAMGLSGLQVMSDDDALSVRGQGYGSTSAVAWGSSWAAISSNYGAAFSTNGYYADGVHYADGANLSFAGILIKELEHDKKGGKSHGGDAHHGNKRGGKPGGDYPNDSLDRRSDNSYGGMSSYGGRKGGEHSKGDYGGMKGGRNKGGHGGMKGGHSKGSHGGKGGHGGGAKAVVVFAGGFSRASAH